MAGPLAASVSDFGSRLGADLHSCSLLSTSCSRRIAVPRWYLWAVSRTRKAVLSLTALLVVAACALIIAGLWAGILAAVAAVVAAGAAVWPLVTALSKALPPPELQVPDWVIERPTELAQVVEALIGDRNGTVGITTALQGAGGFGKTTLAKMVCMDRQVRTHFGGRIYLVTMGRDVRTAAAVAAKVNDMIKLVAGEEANFTDPELAGQRLGALLDVGSRRLLLLDDVWEPEQLAPFANGGRYCVRLVTTRVPGLLAGRGTAVRVDQMSAEQSRRLLTHELPPISGTVTDTLLAVTGRWPLLLRMANKILASAVDAGQDVSAAGTALAGRLRAVGPTAADHLLGVTGLDVDQPDQRARAVRATIEASTSLLSPRDAERLAELAVFAEDEVIPFRLVVRLWYETAGLSELEASQVRQRLVGLGLVTLPSAEAGSGGLTLHDVVRDFLRGELETDLLARLHGVLLDATAATLPPAGPLGPAASGSVSVAWWKLGDADGYMWDHLIEHLIASKRADEAEAVASDLRWVDSRLVRFGPAAPAADLSLVGTQRTARLAATLTRTAHLLARTDPAEAVVDVLHSRVADDPDWSDQVAAIRDQCHRPQLVNRWPMPDLADPAFQRALTADGAWVSAMAIAPDGTWLATGTGTGTSGTGPVRTVRIWDTASWTQKATLTSHGGVGAMAIAPDGTWLATTGGISGTGPVRTVRIWDTASWTQKATLTGHGGVGAMAIAPDGTWLATGDGRTVRIWDTASWTQKATLTSHRRFRGARLAIAPDGTWLASTGLAARGPVRTVRIWDTATWTQKATLTGHEDVGAMAIAPDGTWLATGGEDGRCGSGTPPAGPRKPPSPATRTGGRDGDRTRRHLARHHRRRLQRRDGADLGHRQLDPESHPHRRTEA